MTVCGCTVGPVTTTVTPGSGSPVASSLTTPWIAPVVASWARASRSSRRPLPVTAAVPSTAATKKCFAFVFMETAPSGRGGEAERRGGAVGQAHAEEVGDVREVDGVGGAGDEAARHRDRQ